MLDELGWKNGTNIVIDVQWWSDNPERIRAGVAELLSVSPDVIMAWTNLAVSALKPVARSVPIVFVTVGDPLGSGFVESLAHPGGNITGFASYEPSMGSKWLEVLKKTVPNLATSLVLMHPETAVHQAFWRSIATAAPGLGVDAVSAPMHDAAEIERVISSFGSTKNGGLVVLPHAITQAHRDMIVGLETQYVLPAIHATYGGGELVSYGLDFEDNFRKTADYVDRILRGAKPSELPVQEPTTYRLVINLKTAKTLGITVPQSMLLLADEVIE